MGVVFIIVVIGLGALGVLHFKKKKVEEAATLKKPFTGGIDLPKDKVDYIEDENLKPE